MRREDLKIGMLLYHRGLGNVTFSEGCAELMKTHADPTSCFVDEGHETKEVSLAQLFEMFTAWISKHALTQGIFVIQARASGVSPNMVVNIQNANEGFHGEGRDWHRTKEGAIARANVMRIAKIASMKKTIAKLEKKVF